MLMGFNASLLCLLLIILEASCFTLQQRMMRRNFAILTPTHSRMSSNDESLEESMKNARKCSDRGLSPGAGLATADEQSDAAYADLINTSMDQRGIDSLSAEEIKALDKGGKMWEKGSKSQKNSLGLFGDIANVLTAFAGGAHIEKNKFGET